MSTEMNKEIDLSSCLGFVEVEFLSVTFLIADTIARESDIHILGLEPLGTEKILIRICADTPSKIEAALDMATKKAREVGSSCVTANLARPPSELGTLNRGPLIINQLYEGREEFRPTDFNPNLKTKMNANEAIGILETQGLTAILEATDTMLKAADVHLVGKEKIGAAYVTIIIRGDVAAVKTAIDAGQKAAATLGKVIAAHVIARPHEDFLALLPG